MLKKQDLHTAMCARFEQTADDKSLARRYGLTLLPAQDRGEAGAFGLRPAAEIRPTDLALAISAVMDSNGKPLRRVGRLHFGLGVDWQPQPLINARMESLAEKSTFKPMLEQRCLIPATGWFEWRKDTSGKGHKNRIYSGSARLFSFAALWQGTGFVILTRAPVSSIAHVHDRMPMALTDPVMEAHWLNPAHSFEKVVSALSPADDFTADEEAPRQANLF